jgi:GMP synthase (glutamine-hydrolysing)
MRHHVPVPQRFLFLASRPEDEVADDEYDSLLRLGGLDEGELVRVRMEAGPLPDLDLDDWTGVVLGGSPFTASIPHSRKRADQRRVEAELEPVLAEILERDMPFLGICYGVGSMGMVAGGVVDGTYREDTGPVTVSLTEAGLADDVARVLPPRFAAFVGHTEAFRVPPPSSAVLAGSATCPVQLLRVRRNVYVTQFHPEMSHASLTVRIRAYKHHGYFAPETAEHLIADTAGVDVSAGHALIPAWLEHARRAAGG